MVLKEVTKVISDGLHHFMRVYDYCNIVVIGEEINPSAVLQEIAFLREFLSNVRQPEVEPRDEFEWGNDFSLAQKPIDLKMGDRRRLLLPIHFTQEIMPRGPPIAYWAHSG